MLKTIRALFAFFALWFPLAAGLSPNAVLNHLTQSSTVVVKNSESHALIHSDGSHRRDQSSECAALLDTLNTCLMVEQEHPNCFSCVESAVANNDFTGNGTLLCAQYEAVLCSAIYQDCPCTFCKTEYEKYWSCELNSTTERVCSLLCDAC
jgi:hypothetical protein